MSSLRQWFTHEVTLTIFLAILIGIAGGLGSVVFTHLIHAVSYVSVDAILAWSDDKPPAFYLLLFTPILGLLIVSWLTLRFAPEAQGHGVPEVIAAVARRDGLIRPRVAFVKILASGICIGTGGSVGREGPIVQIGAALGSISGQFLKLSARNMKVLVASGSAAGISATFNAPLAGVMFASEIVLGNFAVESLTPIVIASVLAAVVQSEIGEHGFNPAFTQLYHQFEGAWAQLPSYLILGVVCGLIAVSFTKLVYYTEDLALKNVSRWWQRAVLAGFIVGLAGILYPPVPPAPSNYSNYRQEAGEHREPPLFGVGYEVVDHALHLEFSEKTSSIRDHELEAGQEKVVQLSEPQMISTFWWLLPLALLKPLLTSITLGGGGSGGIFAPSLYIGATTGACFGLLLNLYLPEQFSAHPGVYAIVGMGAVVAGTTHGIMSAIIIVYEMTSDYRIILPIMVSAGLASLVARFVDPESIYDKKLSRRGETVARGLDMHHLEHVMVRDVMIRNFPTVLNTDNLTQIIQVAQKNSHIESIPVMNVEKQLIGIIRPEDLHRMLDTDIPPHLLNADDIALASPISVSPDENLLEAIRDFGTRDVDSLPVERIINGQRQLVGVLLRSEVMLRYRQEMLRHY
ncbi:chloride channel protein [Polystyrenella longa]|uniref:chloride channel protein n=1 Tax=Polystyrenella longa TaxID=2528007 RepID=UPI0018D2734A|nr:chloride channel protein [Polystyrenella longa]